jgi:hypothetical protein
MDEINGLDATNNQLTQVVLGAVISGISCVTLFVMYMRLNKKNNALAEENATIVNYLVEKGMAKIEYRDGHPGILFLE